ncbi:MAG: hypothetical protein H6713_23070 [Myxococcales bacterium]|nr:hypothetical protein [Myxococcales bacterium]MCB9752847.1 hypothetical protein [Myxococcales bacterium]
MTTDPRRLFQDSSVPEALRADLTSAMQHDSVGYDAAAGLQRLEASLAMGAGPAVQASGGLGLGLGLGLGGLGVLAVALWLGFGSPSPEDTTAAGAGPSAARVDASAPILEERGPAKSFATRSATPHTAEVPEEPASLKEDPEEESGELLAERPAAVDSSPPAADSEGVHEEAPRSARRGRRGTDEASSKHAAAGEGARPDDRYLREVRQLHRARGSLERDPQRALELARAGQREFPDGALAQEWEGLVILSLAELGQREEAARLGAAFLERYPDGPFAARIRLALTP